MSFWARLGLAITDLEVFKQMCDRHGVEYIANEDENYQMQGQRVVARLRDTQGRSGQRESFLVEQGGAFKLLWDNDTYYNSMSQRLGHNGGMLTRDYTTEVIKKTSQAAGGFIMSEEQAPDGSIMLKVGMA